MKAINNSNVDTIAKFLYVLHKIGLVDNYTNLPREYLFIITLLRISDQMEHERKN